MIRVMQANLNRSKTANELLYQLVYEKKSDLLIISEQYQDRQLPIWYSDDLGTAAIWIPDPGKVPVKEHGRGRGFAWVKCGSVTYFSVYLTPNDPILEFRSKVDGLEEAVLNTAGGIVVAGDFNGKALEWGMPFPDTRGKYILEMAARTGLLVLNEGNTSTFRRPGYTETIPDVSFGSECIAPRVMNWEVIEDYTGSDHQYIIFEVREEYRQRREHCDRTFRWNAERMDVDRFAAVLYRGVPESLEADGRIDAEELVASTMRLVTEACEASMPRKFPRHGKRPAYWWTAEIADLRRECLRLRRIAQRAGNSAEANLRSAEHKTKKRQLRRAINNSKARCWKKLGEDIDEDPWGLGYKLVTQKLGALKSTSVMDATTMNNIVRTLFPTHPERDIVSVDHGGEIPLFSLEELERAIQTLKTKRAPGPDGIPNEVLKEVFKQNPDLLLKMYNKSLEQGIFSDSWKVARLVLIPKGKGDPEVPSSYRPLCMLDTAGKVLEKLLRPRLRAAIEAAGDLSPKQYGFRVGRSTMNAITEVIEAVKRAEDHNHFSRRIVLLVTLDVKNAFNCAKWSDMLRALGDTFQVPSYLLRMIGDYLKNRSLVYETKEGQRNKAVTAGAAQGSILGPDLWNAAYDSLLRADMPDETLLVGYADDVAALIAARDVELAQLKLNQVMRTVNNWMEEHGLSLALNKTEIVILTKKRMDVVLPMRLGDEVVVTKLVAKYLGISVDCRLNFWEQIKQTADKAAKGVTALSRLMANTGGPKSSRRRLLMSAVQATLLYGSEVWAGALSKEKYRKRLAQVQRRAALRVASAYRTVSEPAVLIIAGVIPIALLAGERQAIYRRREEADKKKVRQEERASTLASWQESWNEEERGRWTARLIGLLKPWIERRHGEIDYYLTQFLSGHGYFRAYLHKMGKTATSECLYCIGATDDAHHTFFVCDRWARRRRDLEDEIGQVTPDNIVGAMLREEKVWIRISHWAQGILRTKKGDLDQIAAASP